MRHPFDPTLPWFLTDTKPRCDRLTELSRAGWVTPKNGPWSNLKRLGRPLVLYLDERAHCGEGKQLWTPGDAPPENPYTWCSEWVGQGEATKPQMDYSVTHRSLFIGDVRVEITYTSHESWMSNVGGTYEVLPHQLSRDPKDLLRYALYAVDTVESSDYPYCWAIDLNVCPGIPLDVFNLFGRGNLQAAFDSFVEKNQ